MNKNIIKYNDKITAKEVRLIDENGIFVGNLAFETAFEMAKEKELDIVLIAENTEPPVAKLCRVDKYLFEMKQKEKQIRKNSDKIKLKEIKLGLKIDFGDLQTKMKHAEKFLKEGNKVRFFMRFKRKELPEAQKGIELLKTVASKLRNVQIEKDVSMEKNVARLTIKPIKQTNETTKQTVETAVKET